MATLEITQDNFKDTIEKGGIVLLDFWAEWCGPCKMFAPIFEKASEAHADVVFGKIDTEAQQELAGAASISAIPTLMLFRDGVLLFRESGALPPAALEELVKQAKSLDMEKVKKEIEEHQAHEHGPGCNHDHDHDHGHDHGHAHAGGHDHGHSHDHDHGSHAHAAGHDHGPGGHDHAHGHDHGHGHSHDHGSHAHAAGDDHKHAGDGHKHGPGDGHDH